jgi:peptidoglycan/xylan/chitin deacetylase (PgdA/CDA1 family)
MSILRQTFRTALSISLPRKWLLVSAPTSTRSICLTFDDGPHPEHTPQLLDVLKQHNVTATFFVIGEQAEKHPDLIRRMAAEGHAVGQHSFFHTEPTKTSAPQLMDEVRRTTTTLEKILGRPCPLFRPPKGHLTAKKLLALRKANLSIILWNVDPRDYRTDSADTLKTWFHNHPLKSGDIILLHDIKPHAANLIPNLAKMARDQNLTFTHPLAWQTKFPTTKVAAL